jgi:predicted glycosyltransferase
MKIWLDLANSPQVYFFHPILAELQRRGHTVEITSRAYAQTVVLADQFGLQHTIIGRHGGHGYVQLARQIWRRALMLTRWAREQRFDLAVGFNSGSLAIAAVLLRVASVGLVDYEYHPLSHLTFRLARRVIVPGVFSTDVLRRFGAARKTVPYPGVKEQVYLTGFEPQPDYRQSEGFPAELPLVVVRPPATWAPYHRSDNDLFGRLLAHIARGDARYLLFLPRMPGQAESVRALPHVRVATRVYNGPDLLYHADLVISAGGTMNREAAVLGTPTYSVFEGRLGAVDRYLLSLGRMKRLQSPDDLAHVHVARHDTRLPVLEREGLVTLLADQILSAV